jgi:CubicO group peptidase (beta-lactamase class C family)
MRWLKRIELLPALLGITVLVCIGCLGDAAEFDVADISDEAWPGPTWQKVDRPERLGWSSEKLAEARRYAKKIDTAAVMIVDDGVVIDAWGDIARNFRCHSMRKSLLSGLIGTFVSGGRIDLSRTLAQLNINDYPNHLSETEKQATVGDLIRARSGIYIEALGESPDMKARRPRRHSHAPGTHWYYNNWDFNALGTIFEQQTGENLFEALDRKLAGPLQMQDFDPANCRYLSNLDYSTPGLTMHRYYDIRMSARDLARFGLLFLREGRWRDKQILPRKWVWESTASHSRYGQYSGYGYMWWTGSETGLYGNVRLKAHSFAAAGWGGHRLIVLPWRRLVVVHRVDTDRSQTSVANHQIGRLLWHILDAAGESEIGPEPTLRAAKGRRLTDDQLGKILPGSTIRGPDFKASLTRDYRFVLWSDARQLDSGRWGIEDGKFWLRSRLLTGGHKIKLSMVLHDDRLQWYDRQGTLQGEGLIKREVNDYEKNSYHPHIRPHTDVRRIMHWRS